MSDHSPIPFEALHKNLHRLESYSLPADAAALLQNTIGLAEELDASLKAEYAALHEAILMSQQAKNKFVSVITHELRLPLTSIKGYTDLLRQGIAGPVNEQQLNFLNTVRSNTERMARLISDLADISHLETGRMKFALLATPVRQSLEETVEHFKVTIAEKSLGVEVDAPEGIPDVAADQARLIQVLSCLLDNACAYTPPQGNVVMRAIQLSDVVRFEVCDTGIGVSLADQPKVFSQFFRSEDDAVREHPGWGLSLHLSKRLVEALGGKMGFESIPGSGSTFWFSLPIHQVPA